MFTTYPKIPLSERIKERISQLYGVISVKVITVDSDEVSEIRLLTNSQITKEQLFHDIAFLLREQFSIKIDITKISILQIGKDRIPTVLIGNDERIKLISLNITVAGSNCEVQVKVLRNGWEVTGNAAGPSSKNNLLKLVATATIDSVNKFLPENYLWIVEDLTIIQLGEKEIVTVLLNSITSKTEKMLVGSSIVEQDIQQATAFATLDAVNRYLGSLFSSLSANSNTSLPDTIPEMESWVPPSFIW